ncbi:hypothetical protein [Flagellimonas meridianipacifica]|uniref:Lipoprotein n=1 Tax=Flagellimonas meridianipacifica TaxID=1080225 RepID=A0A2T0MI57_9FLAO|nr:hypothetical protein [Allomuricauda pacifica]PRX57264.1 hypothetical protein CLV81_1267 [Allomuricauda pacifica]
MRKTRAIIILLVVLGCKEKQTVGADSQSESQEFNYQKLPKKLEVSAEAAIILDEWPEFKALNSSVDVLYKSTNNEDLSLAIDDLLEKEKELSASTYPEPFDSFQIKSRQRVFRTLLLKVKASVLNKSDTTEPTIELLEAYNIIREQFNSILSSQLDTKLILDEEE